MEGRDSRVGRAVSGQDSGWAEGRRRWGHNLALVPNSSPTAQSQAGLVCAIDFGGADPSTSIRGKEETFHLPQAGNHSSKLVMDAAQACQPASSSVC